MSWKNFNGGSTGPREIEIAPGPVRPEIERGRWDVGVRGIVRPLWARRSHEAMPLSDNVVDAWMEVLKAQHPDCEFFLAVIEIAPPQKPIWKDGLFWLAVVIGGLVAAGLVPVVVHWWEGLCQ